MKREDKERMYSEKTIVVKWQAVYCGINFFDTANVYAEGTSEEYLGRALRRHLPRDRYVIATKVYFNEGHLSRQAILKEIDGSLKRLGTDYVDLYVIHRFDYDTPIEETLETLDSLVKAGKVRALGASAMFGYQFANLLQCAGENGWTQFVSMQNHYNLIYREEEREMIPICRQHDIAITPFCPLASGRLARPNWTADSKRSATDASAVAKYDACRETDEKIVFRVRELAEKYGRPMSSIALAWLLARGVTAPVIGTTKAKYIDDALAALDFALEQEDMAYLEQLYQPHRVVGAV